MKKIALILILTLTLVSCWAKTQEVENNKKTNQNNIENQENNKKENEAYKIKEFDIVEVSYTGSLEDGNIFDSSSMHDWETLRFEVGAGKMIAGFEKAVIWMKLGEIKNVKIEAKDAYGESNELLLTQADFDAIEQWGLKKEDMEVWVNKIWEVWEIEILRIENWNYYAKHPSHLAWENLIFDIKIDKIIPYVKKDIVSAWDYVSVSYTWTLKDGTVFDATSRHNWIPLEFTAWAGQMIPWFDAWIIGMKLWETKKIEIEAKDAYWEKWTHELAWKDLIFDVKVEGIR